MGRTIGTVSKGPVVICLFLLTAHITITYGKRNDGKDRCHHVPLVR